MNCGLVIIPTYNEIENIESIVRTVFSLHKPFHVLIVDDNSPDKTADKVREAIAKNARCQFDVVSNPEFLREGFAVSDFMKPDRVVIGAGSERARKVMEQLYKPFVRQGNPIIFMDERSAELTKYAANSFLATKITFMNEVANFCEILAFLWQYLTG